jgi:putative ABC transport system ATP-binding protein
LITLRDLTREYTSGERTVHALDGVSLAIARNEFVAISGPSGCGKSTLIHLLAGLDRPTSGEIFVDQIALHSANDAALTEFRRRQVGLVFQFFNLLPTMNVRENVSLPLLLQGVAPAECDQRADALIALVGLQERADHFVHQLSGGAASVMELLDKIGREALTTLIVVTHSSEVARAASRRIEMRDGRIAGDSAT